MNLNPRKLNIVLILVYLVCTLFSAYTLFQLQEDIVYSSYSISVNDIAAAQPVLIKLNLIVGFTLLIGIGSLVFLFKNRNEDIIYVEKKRLKDLQGEEEDKEKEDKEKQFSTAFINEILQKEKDEQKAFDKSLNAICKKLEAGVGVLYTYKKTKDKNLLEMKSSYALSLGESQVLAYEMGEGLVGQAAKERKTLLVDDIPEGYIKVVSGLGSASPTHLLVCPFEKDNKLLGVIEIATFTKLEKAHETFVKSCMDIIVDKLNTKDGETRKAARPKKEEATAKKETNKGKNEKA